MREKMDAIARETPYFPDSKTDSLTQEKMLTRTTFLRMVSGQEEPVILMSGELSDEGLRQGYDDIYGPREGSDNEQRRPMPGLKSMTATFQGGTKASRKATVSWICWSFDDLNRLMPHFLAHGKTIMLQWGWVYDKDSLLRIKSYTSGDKISEDAFNANHLRDIIDNNGDYDMMTGVISNFSFTARQDGGFDCETVITSVGINLFSSTEGTLSSIDPMINYDLTTRELEGGKKDFKLKQSTQDAYQEGDDVEIISLNSTVSLKIFLQNIDTYIFQQLSGTKNIESFDERKSELGDPVEISWEPNKYIRMDVGIQDKLARSKFKGKHIDTWVRWGWFEDNVLSKFLSVTSETGKVISEFRSIERMLDSKLKPLLDKDNKPIFQSTLIKSHPQMQTLSINEYILPGKFYPQTEEFTTEVFGEDVNFPGDRDAIIKLANITNDEENFPRFELSNYTGTKQQNLRLMKEMGEDFKKKDKETNAQARARRKKYYDENILSNRPGGASHGYMRNMLINTKLIKKAFGIGDDGLNVESINIFESIDSMFSLLNQKIAYWDFELASDEVDSFRLKIIDATTTWIDFRRPPSSQITRFIDNTVVGKPGVFYFPVWKSNSIVKSQDLQAKIPSSMQLAAMYGSNVDAVNDYSKSSFQETLGTAAGGLFNDKADKRNKGLNIAFRNKNTENLGNKDGNANAKLTNDGEDIKTFIVNNESFLTNRLQDDLNDVAEKIIASGLGGEAEFDSSKPPPFFDNLNPDEKKQLLSSKQQEPRPFKGQIADKYKQLFSSKFDKNGDMRNAYIGTIDVLISNWDKDDNNKDNRPLKMLFDLNLEIDGIGGIIPGNSFHSAYLPQKYLEACVFQASNVEHTVDGSTWTTSISGMMRSTLGYVFSDKSVSQETEELLDNLTGNVMVKKKAEVKTDPVEEINKKVPELKSL